MNLADQLWRPVLERGQASVYECAPLSEVVLGDSMTQQFPEIGIVTGISLEEVIERLSAEIVALRQRVAELEQREPDDTGADAALP